MTEQSETLSNSSLEEAGRAVAVEAPADLRGKAEQRAVASSCTQGDLDHLSARATEGEPSYELKCNAILQPGITVTKRIVIQSSGVSLDCKGATIDGRGFPWTDPNIDMIEVKSREAGDANWDRPRDVTVVNCNVVGSIRVFGMCRNGQDCEKQKISSRRPGHTQRARNAAPRNVAFERLHLTGYHRIPMYLGPGVTRTTLSNSTLDGSSVGGALYLDAESAFNTIRGNSFFVKADSNVVSIDGSSNNRIINNYFSGLGNGGIYLYRNCGEGGTVRWNTPSANEIINNVFYYKSGSRHPAVFIGARGPNHAGYCGEDDDSPYGSGAHNEDFANDNVVVQNQIYARSAADMIKHVTYGSRENFVTANEGSLRAHVERKAGCYRANGYPNRLVVDGAAFDAELADDRPRCTTFLERCSDGDTHSEPNSCTISTVKFGCSASNSNAGCAGTVQCRGDTRILAATAACNLELGEVLSSELNAVPVNKVTVVRPSDDQSEGACTVASTTVSEGTANLEGEKGQQRVNFRCRERDSDGGDCSLKGELYCR